MVETGLCVLLLAATDKWKKKKSKNRQDLQDNNTTLPAQLAYFLRSYFLLKFWHGNNDGFDWAPVNGRHFLFLCIGFIVRRWGGRGRSGRGRVWGKQLLEMTQSRTSLWPPTPVHQHQHTHDFCACSPSRISSKLLIWDAKMLKSCLQNHYREAYTYLEALCTNIWSAIPKICPVSIFKPGVATTRPLLPVAFLLLG